LLLWGTEEGDHRLSFEMDKRMSLRVKRSLQAAEIEIHPHVRILPDILLPAGGDQPLNNMQPYLTLNFCIALQGAYPPRT
jgi:Microcystin-dependent protein